MTFRDGSIATIKGKRSINILRLPIFYNVLFVNGLFFLFEETQLPRKRTLWAQVSE